MGESAVREDLIARIGPSLVSAVPHRLRGCPRVLRGVGLVGFDTEWAVSDGRLLSIQFAARCPDRGVSAEVIYPGVRRLERVVFIEHLVRFLRANGLVPPSIRGRRRVVLVAHFSQAELGMFDDALRDSADMKQIGKAHHVRFPDVDFGDGTSLRVEIRDLYAFYKMSLAKIGVGVGLPKVDVDPRTLEELLESDRPRYEEYAAVDAKIAFLAFEFLRETTLRDWSTDVLTTWTLPALASAIFRRHFLKNFPVPTRTVLVQENRKRVAGWRKRRVEKVRYDGPAERRYAACRAFWGGRAEAFVRGLVQSDVHEFDVVSLYPSAALLQPLPNASTKWRKVTTVKEVQELEGFGTFEFAFPHGQKYPCLPVTRDGADRLAFTTTGRTSCTFAEVRAAIELGATILRVVDADGFVAGESERNHDLAAYLSHFMEKKNRAEKKSLEYETYKLHMNGLIGKFAERREDSDVLPLERIARHNGLGGLVGLLSRGALRSAFKRPNGVGSLWLPEWGTLIHGRARAIMAPFVAKGALLVSTDAVLVDASVDLTCPELAALRSVGSDMERKVIADAVFIVRSRLYAMLQDANNIRSGSQVIARDDRWAVVRVARHATVETDVEFAETVLACLRAGRDVAPKRERVRLAAAETAVRKDVPINSELLQEGRTHFRWDLKRRVHDRDVNIFRAMSVTSPYRSLAKLEAAEHDREVRAGTARRSRRAYGWDTVDAVLEMLERGKSVREIVEATGVPRSTVYDLKRRSAVSA